MNSQKIQETIIKETNEIIAKVVREKKLRQWQKNRAEWIRKRRLGIK